MKTMLEVTNLYKSFKNLEVLRGVSLQINEGEVVAVIGPSGSGKTTLLRCVTQLERATHGSIHICGETLCSEAASGSLYVDKQKRHELQLKMGLVFQSFNLFPHYSVLKNIIKAPMDVQGKSREEAE